MDAAIRSFRLCGAIVGLALCAACGGSDSLEEIRERQSRGDFRSTVEPLRELLETHPSNSEVHLLYGLALARTGQGSLALWSLREASEDPTWFVPASLELARSALSARDFPAAIASATAVLEEVPDHVDALRVRGQARLEEKIDAEGGLEDLTRALDLEPGDLATRLSQLRALLAVGRVDEAREAFGEVERMASEGEFLEADASLVCAAGASFVNESGEHEAAAGLYEGCLERYPASAAVMDAAMDFFDARGNASRATEILRAASEASPYSTVLRGRLARRLRSQGALEEAEELLLAATRRDEEEIRAHAWSALTDHYVVMGDHDAAVDAFESAIEYEGELTAQRRLAYADLLAAAQRNERALEVAAELEDVALRDLVQARVALNEGRACEALEHFEAAFPLWPNNAVARYYAAVAAERCGVFEKAEEHYRQSLRSGAQASDAGLRLARRLVAERRWSDALFAIQQHLAAHPSHPEAVLLKTRIALALQEPEILQGTLNMLPPSRLRARVIVLLADRAARDRGAEFAIGGLLADDRLKLRQPRDAPALELLVTLLLETERRVEARLAVDAALAANAEAADFHFIHGRFLELDGAPGAEARSAFERALARNPAHAGALLVLGRQAGSEGRTREAVELLDRAFAAESSDPTPAREAAQLLVAAGESDEAVRRLEALLKDLPHDGLAAAELSRLLRSRGGEPARIESLARQAARFGATRAPAGDPTGEPSAAQGPG